MAQDSKLWQQAYNSYKERFPSSQYNDGKTRTRRTLGKEPMILLEEYRELEKQIRELSKKKKELFRQLKLQGKSDYVRSDYFERPILLYAIKLTGGCWYVGMSRNVDRRYKAHEKGKTMWTKEHPPIGIHEVRETGLTSDSEAAKLEDEMTLEYARLYGAEYVRGGGYCQRKPLWPREAYEVDLSFLR